MCDHFNSFSNAPITCQSSPQGDPVNAHNNTLWESPSLSPLYR